MVNVRLYYLLVLSIKIKKGEHESWDTQFWSWWKRRLQRQLHTSPRFSALNAILVWASAYLQLDLFSPPTGLSPWDSWQGLCPHFSASEDPSPPSMPTLQQTPIVPLINIVTMSNVFMGSPQRRVPFHSYNTFQLTKFSLICVILHNPDCKCLYRLSYSLIDQNGSQSMASSMQCHQGYRMDWHPGLTLDTALRSPSHQGWHRSDVETNMRENSLLWASKDLPLPLPSYIHLWSCIAIKMLGESERQEGETMEERRRKGINWLSSFMSQCLLYSLTQGFPVLPISRIVDHGMSMPWFSNSKQRCSMNYTGAYSTMSKSVNDFLAWPMSKIPQKALKRPAW